MSSKRASSIRKSDGTAETPTKRQKTQASPRAESRDSLASTQKKAAPTPEEERDQLKQWLDKKDKSRDAIFQIKYPGPPGKGKGKKRKSAGVLDEQLRLGGHDSLKVEYFISPASKWELLKKFRNFTVGDETIATGQVVLVKHGDGGERKEKDEMDTASQWKAQVLEVRALDPSHVYLRVTWLNRPVDLPDGPKPYHGRNELIATNDMAIIDAMSINGALDVKHWDEYADDDAMIEEDQYFWRQTYDIHSKTLSGCRQVCKCDMPHNPDEVILQCSHPDCRQWLHVRCIVEDAVEQARSKHSNSDNHAGETNGTKVTPKGKAGTPKGKTGTPKGKAKVKREEVETPGMFDKGEITADVLIKGEPKDDPAPKNRIVLVDKTSGVAREEEQDVVCLICKRPID